MTWRLEINPPRVIQDTILSQKELQGALSKIRQRVVDISAVCNGIHLTDSVLGIPRVSPLTLGAIIRKSEQKINLTASVRVRDRNLTSMTQSMCDALLLGLNGVLILKGDEPPKGPKDSHLVPSQVVKSFNELGFGDKIDLFLSLPSYPDFSKIQKKIEAEPAGFFTQVVHSVEDVVKIVDKLKPQGFKIIPVVLIPSEKNLKSAEFLHLDWSNYEDNVTGFVSEIQKLTGDVLITSPNDFNQAKVLFEKLA